MPREATLFEITGGNVTDAFLLLRAEKKNIPPSWIQRAHESRKSREKRLSLFLRKGQLDAIGYMKDWYIAYQKECFYNGIRALFELERKGKTKY